ncbi:conserved hypothetical protein [Ricinus communis]|uniref:Uncharacterized protein n=1 Tax=Ricinus communis TaxID=3988 RepID=B9T4A0_RICCO|nr:conserved hypothetical protein [Ricinus communis]
MVLIVVLHNYKLRCRTHQRREYTYGQAWRGMVANEPAGRKHTHHLTDSATCNNLVAQMIHIHHPCVHAYAYAYAWIHAHVHASLLHYILHDHSPDLYHGHDYDCFHAYTLEYKHGHVHAFEHYHDHVHVLCGREHYHYCVHALER